MDSANTETDKPPIRIKLLGKYKPGADGEGWFRNFPGGKPIWGNCHYTFDRNCREYDWLVVYDDLPSLAGERHTLWAEELACPPENTLLIITEPSTIKVYGSDYLHQFRWVLTSQEQWAVGNHPGSIHQQPGLVWFYADSDPRGCYDTIVSHVPLAKTKDISTVCSKKQQTHTLHNRRYNFIMALKNELPEMDVFGHGVRFITDKADALDPYRYHVAIENFYGPDHWTEKLADPFLGACMPIYYGCPNAEDYFPPESFIRIDMSDVGAAAETIRRAIKDRLYEKNLDAILESRRRVLENYGPIAQISRLVTERHSYSAAPSIPAATILSRRRIQRRCLTNTLRYGLEKFTTSMRHAIDRY